MTTNHRDSFARSGARAALRAAHELKDDLAALWVRVGVVEEKTASIRRLGNCGICGEWCSGRYCRQCASLFEDGE